MSDSGPQVTILNGKIQGRRIKTEDGVEFHSFQGIPYAKPPLGELRFQAPQPMDSWEGVRDATKEGNISWQLDILANSTISGDEDCLFINVYTPKLPADGGKDIPVMVYIHGGAFVMGSGNADHLGPDYLVSEGIILVTFNYRLGPLGFLSLEHEKLSGNAGLKDQVAALQWVRDNIRFFGGDPNNVTVTGESAGGASVHYQILSKRATGLFNRAISQSGSALNPWALQLNPLQNAFDLCKVLGHQTNDKVDAINFLQTVPPKDLIDGHQKLSDESASFGLAMIFVPTIEKTMPGVESFITEDAVKIMNEGSFNQVPYISGFNSEEGLIALPRFLHKIIPYEYLNTKSEYIVPSSIPKENTAEAFAKFKTFYFKNETISEDHLMLFSHLKGDVDFNHGIYKTVKLQSKTSKSPVYFYRYAFEEFGLMKTMFQIPSHLTGAAHADELAFLFKVKGLPVNFIKDSNNDITQRRLLKLWTNFVKAGNPTPAADDLIPVVWEPAAEALNFLDINVNLTMQCKNPIQERVEFLEELYESLL